MVPFHQRSCCLQKVLIMLYLLCLLFILPPLISAHQTRLLFDSRDVENQDGDHSPISKKINSTTTKTSSKNQTKSIKPSSISSNKNQTKLVKSSSVSIKNQTKLIKPTPASSKNQTKLTSPTSSKNQTKLIKSTPLDPAKNKTKLIKPTTADSKNDSSPKSQIKNPKNPKNSTKISSTSPKKSADLTKLTSPKTKTTKETKSQSKSSPTKPKSKSPIKAHARPEETPSQIDEEEDEDEDLITAFRDLPYRFHETFVPDLERISKTSKMYLTNYNHEITKGFKPYVGTKHAPTVASIASFAFIVIPLILVSLVFNRITAYVSLQKILIFVQFYLALYFAILALSALVTGIEPLRFFYSNSQSTYVGVQVLQTLAYVLYLVLLLMYLIVAFSSETGMGSKLLGLTQTFVGIAIGLHYYVTVFHRAVLHQAPKSSWRVHGLYATCFVVIGLLGTAGRRKKAYLEDGGEEGKKS